MSQILLDVYAQVVHLCSPYPPPGQVTPEGLVQDDVYHDVAIWGSNVRPDAIFFRETVHHDGTVTNHPLLAIELKRRIILGEVPEHDSLCYSYHGRSAVVGASVTKTVRSQVRKIVHQAFVYLRELDLTYGAISTYHRTWCLRRSRGNHLQISDPIFVATKGGTKPTWRRALAFALTLVDRQPLFPDPDPASAPDVSVPGGGKGSGGPSSRDPRPSSSGPHTRSKGPLEGRSGGQGGAQDMDAVDEPDDEGYSSAAGLKQLPASAVVVDRASRIGSGSFGPCCRGTFLGEPAALKRCDLWKTPNGPQLIAAEVEAYGKLEDLWDDAVVRFLGRGSRLLGEEDVSASSSLTGTQRLRLTAALHAPPALRVFPLAAPASDTSRPHLRNLPIAPPPPDASDRVLRPRPHKSVHSLAAPPSFALSLDRPTCSSIPVSSVRVLEYLPRHIGNVRFWLSKEYIASFRRDLRAELLSISPDLLAEQNIHKFQTPLLDDKNDDLREAVFHYQPNTSKSDIFELGISSPAMLAAAWQYAHGEVILMDGTFSVYLHKILLFVMLVIGENNHGVPVALFLFSAPLGNSRTSSGYDSKILEQFL
ncbi:hypothetical protein BDK51DRAFT_42159 [Blyttiomyces helicus]|uniref:Uncharacterized protein n=1 Tax=Blyttiomyces helicus TaxID=388810 RepID=A0A4P9WSN0_9FUNG|nr:hypothetical protein BDK51DRAFT_42159 [Blyttiomyces helicus]|eukprot:RKO94310.1 hypothetical protein BDK51DRAFT_42159 [Blyttiomyces helicus]